MKTTAAILVEPSKPLVLGELEVPRLSSGQVLVELAYSSICHTQILEVRGFRGYDPYLPHCLGHEGTGIVRMVGGEVSKVKVGDPVILSWIKSSGLDAPSSVYKWEGRDVNAGGITTFGKHMVISENRLSHLPNDISMRDATLLGCAVPTGIGSVLNVAKPSPGNWVVVFGCGGIGLCAINAAAISGCTRIIAVDILQEKLQLAMELGATHIIDAETEDPVSEILNICPNGVDIAIECSGRPENIGYCLSGVRDRGGMAIVVGNPRDGEKTLLDPRELNKGKQVIGTWGGDGTPDQDNPKYFELIRSGSLNLAAMIGDSYALSDINQAITDLETGKSIRPIIDMTL